MFQIPSSTNSISQQRLQKWQRDAGRGWLVGGACVLLVIFLVSDVPAWRWMYNLWMTKPDDSHGLLVPAFSIWLLWYRRQQMSEWQPTTSWTAMILGAVLILGGVGIRCFGIYTRTITLEALSIVPCIAGIVLLTGGWVAVKWAWPAVLFLLFMIPLPSVLGGLLSGALQKIATILSTYCLQTLGVPAISEGNVIWLTDHPVGVAEACSGIRMLTTFFALATAVTFVIERPIWEKFAIVLSAPAVAIVTNGLRITGTALAYEFGSAKAAELIFHDLAGWLMMPLGLLMLWGELFLLSQIFQFVEKPEMRFEQIKL